MAPRNRKLRVKERRYRTRCPATLLLLANRTPNRGTTVNGWDDSDGKYQNGTSYTRVSARHNSDARAPLCSWVSFSKGFWAKNREVRWVRRDTRLTIRVTVWGRGLGGAKSQRVGRLRCRTQPGLSPVPERTGKLAPLTPFYSLDEVMTENRGKGNSAKGKEEQKPVTTVASRLSTRSSYQLYSFSGDRRFCYHNHGSFVYDSPNLFCGPSGSVRTGLTGVRFEPGHRTHLTSLMF